jgi:hypothetical protein
MVNMHVAYEYVGDLQQVAGTQAVDMPGVKEECAPLPEQPDEETGVFILSVDQSVMKSGFHSG